MESRSFAGTGAYPVESRTTSSMVDLLSRTGSIDPGDRSLRADALVRCVWPPVDCVYVLCWPF